MSNIYWLSEDQMAHLESYFPKSLGVRRVDDRRVLRSDFHDYDVDQELW